MIISADPMPLYLCRCAAPPTPCALSATMRALTCTKHFWKKSLSRNPSTHKRQTPYHRKHSPKSHLISPVSPQFLTGFSPGSQPEFHRHTRISPDLPGFSPVSHRFLTAVFHPQTNVCFIVCTVLRPPTTCVFWSGPSARACPVILSRIYVCVLEML
jgi:hypothetical protein